MKPRRSSAVSNAGPLIHLARIGRLHLLRALFQEVAIPIQVKVETVEKGKQKGFPDALLIEGAIEEGWIRTVEVRVNKRFEKVAETAGLQLAEVAVIYYARQNHMTALLDDDAARIFARTLGVTVRGSLGTILEAIERRLLSRSEALKMLDALSEVMYVAPGVYRSIKSLINRAGA